MNKGKYEWNFSFKKFIGKYSLLNVSHIISASMGFSGSP